MPRGNGVIQTRCPPTRLPGSEPGMDTRRLFGARWSWHPRGLGWSPQEAGVPASCSRASGQCGGVRPSLGSEAMCPRQPQPHPSAHPPEARATELGVTQPPRPCAGPGGGRSGFWLPSSQRPSASGVAGVGAMSPPCPPLWGEPRSPWPPTPNYRGQQCPSSPSLARRTHAPHPPVSLSPNVPPASPLPPRPLPVLRLDVPSAPTESPTLLCPGWRPQPRLLLPPCARGGPAGLGKPGS